MPWRVKGDVCKACGLQKGEEIFEASLPAMASAIAGGGRAHGEYRRAVRTTAPKGTGWAGDPKDADEDDGTD